MIFQDTIELASQEKGATDITELISTIVQESKINTGTCQLFVQNSFSRSEERRVGKESGA